MNKLANTNKQTYVKKHIGAGSCLLSTLIHFERSTSGKQAEKHMNIHNLIHVVFTVCYAFTFH